MGKTPPEYPARPGDSSEFDRIEAFRCFQGRRILAIRLGDIYLDLARAYAKHLPRKIPCACGLLVKAADNYGRGGLGRRGAAAWRLARLLHVAQCRKGSR